MQGAIELDGIDGHAVESKATCMPTSEEGCGQRPDPGTRVEQTAFPARCREELGHERRRGAGREELAERGLPLPAGFLGEPKSGSFELRKQRDPLGTGENS